MGAITGLGDFDFGFTVESSGVATEAALFFRFFFSFLASRADSADLSLLRCDDFFSFLLCLVREASSAAWSAFSRLSLSVF